MAERGVGGQAEWGRWMGKNKGRDARGRGEKEGADRGEGDGEEDEERGDDLADSSLNHWWTEEAA